MSVRYLVPAAALLFAAATPAAAQDAAPVAPVTSAAPVDPWVQHRATIDHARAGWIGECRRRYVATYGERRSEGPGLAGLLIGGLLGGAAGYGLAGAGDRAIGTVAGAVLGGAVGGALDKSGRKSRDARTAALLDEADEYCAAYFDYQMAVAQQPGYAHGYAQPMMMVPVAAPAPVVQPAPEPRCHEEVTYEDVDVPVRTRSIPPRARPRDKRLRMD